MKIKRLNVRLASAALSGLIVGNAGFALSTPAYAEGIEDYGLESTDLYNLDYPDDLLFDEEEEEEEEDEEEDEDKEELEEEKEEEQVEIESNEEEEDLVVENNEENLNSVETTPLEEVPTTQEESLEENDDIVESSELEEENETIVTTDVEKDLVEDTTLVANEEENDITLVPVEGNAKVMGFVDENGDTVVALKEGLEKKLEEAIQEDALRTTPATEEVEEEENSQQETTVIPKVAVITSKVDDEGNPLVGAVLQILDSEGNVLDEWISDGEEHVSMIPVGNYILREKTAPEGYVAAADKNFTVQIDIDEVTAGVEHDDSHDVCWHYSGVALYFVESEGLKEEVYCVNQGWEEPNGTNYDGMILDDTNIRDFTPDADSNMTDTELYNKILDIIYHRSKVEELYPDLTETEIRFITEYALKTYTSAEVTTRQARRDENGHLIRDDDGNLIYDDIPFLRQYRYDPTSPKGYVVDPGNGDGIGKLAEHWYNQHNKTPLPPEYASLFYYLIGEEDLHPEDMILYIYSTQNVTEDGEYYQNLLGVKWFDPYDDEYKTILTVVNKKEEVPPEKPPVEPPRPYRPSNCPKTGDNSHVFEYSLLMLASGLGLAGTALVYRNSIKKEEEKVKSK